MTIRTALAIAITLAVIAVLGALIYADRTLAQPVAQIPMAPRGPMMGPGQQMPMGQMLGRMQQHMNQVTADLRAMRAQLDKVNPDLLTPQERPMYEYLKLLQRHMETMQGWMGMVHGTMR